MAQVMPADNPFLQFPFGPIQMECDACDLVVEGEIPADLNGSLYRNGPNQRFNPRSEYHLFAGDGMVHAFHINDGKVDYNNRWVRTAKFNIEDREGRSVLNAMNPMDCEAEYSDFAFVDKEGLANTALVWHGDRLLALEEAHQPYEIDPLTLESIGSWTYRGKLNTPMTAHPKIDPNTGELLFFAYMASGFFSSDLAVHKANAKGILTESITIATPYPAMIHDFAFTENYIIIPVFPITGDLERAMEGGPAFAWEPDKGIHVGILPRHNASAEDIRWLEMDMSFAFHFMNAFELDGKIIVDACQFERPPLFTQVDGSSTGSATPYLNRWSIDLASDHPRVEFEQIDEHQSEFPQCDPRYAGQQYRHGWYTSPDGTMKSHHQDNEDVFNCIGHFDHLTGTSERYSLGQCYASEAVFVPRSADCPEGEGYLLTVVTSNESKNSSLYIFDALNITAGPVAKVHLSHRVPMGFHGTWRADD